MCCRNFCYFSLVTKKCRKRRSKIALFQMSAILKFDFQKRKQLRFSEENYLNYTKKRPNFGCGNYIFPKTRGNKNKQCTHSTPLNLFSVHFNVKCAQYLLRLTVWQFFLIGKYTISGNISHNAIEYVKN